MAYREGRADFRNRYRITGTLETLSPLHVGGGGVVHRQGLVGPDGPLEIQAVMSDRHGNPFISGSSIKGVLLAWLAKHDADVSLLESTFGTQERAGKVEFHNARYRSAPAADNEHRWWCEQRKTCVANHVRIQARTRTAEENFLYYLEFVPEGVLFDAEFRGQNLTSAEIALLLEGLNAFREAAEAPVLGKDTTDGWGRLKWRLGKIEVMEPADEVQWLAAQAESSRLAWHMLRQIDPPTLIGPGPPTGDDRFTVQIMLQFRGAVLVNDPSRCLTAGTERGEGDSRPNHAAIRTRNGRPFLPASSVRGVLRHQAARILRTIAQSRTGGSLSKWKDEAKDSGEQAQLRPFLRLFGAPGWRSPMNVSDFVLEGAEEVREQEFLAVDRFTGGGAPGRKFRAVALEKPLMRGTLSIDTAALKRAAVGDWWAPLIAFTLRDLAEGDIRFGFGSSKGYGECRAEIVLKQRPPALPSPLNQCFPEGQFVAPQAAPREAAGFEQLADVAKGGAL